MIAYAIRRIALMLPTLFAIMVVNFFIVQAAPGGPIQQMISKLKGTDVAATERVSGAGGELRNQPSNTQTQYRGARGLDPAFIKELEKQYGFDKPPLERFVLMIKNYATFDFGTSFFRDRRVVDLIRDKLPVSISIGLWTTLLTYLVSIPLGIRKAVRDGSRFDVWTSAVIIVGYAVPSFLFAVLLIVLFAGGSYFSVFPLRGLVSDDWASFDWPHKILDYFWHIALPIIALVIGGFATLTMLTKNCFLDEINKQYVLTVHRHPVHRRALDRGHLLARRAGAPRLRGGDQPRLPDHVRRALCVHANRAGAEAGQRSDLHADRPAHRFRPAVASSLPCAETRFWPTSSGASKGASR